MQWVLKLRFQKCRPHNLELLLYVQSVFRCNNMYVFFKLELAVLQLLTVCLLFKASEFPRPCRKRQTGIWLPNLWPNQYSNQCIVAQFDVVRCRARDLHTLRKTAYTSSVILSFAEQWGNKIVSDMLKHIQMQGWVHGANTNLGHDSCVVQRQTLTTVLMQVATRWLAVAAEFSCWQCVDATKLMQYKRPLLLQLLLI